MGGEPSSSIRKLKHGILFAKPLSFPNFKKKIMLQTDASNIAIGAVLLQELEGQITPLYPINAGWQL